MKELGEWSVKDEELLARVAQGDLPAFQEFYKRYAPRIFRYALTVLSERHLAEEVVQETMVAVWKGAKNFQRRSKVSTWVFGIARNHALHLLRQENKYAPKSAEIEFQEKIEDVDQAERVRMALAKLPQIEREVVVLAFYQGLSYREIADILGIPEGTVKSRMFYAKKRLREAFGGRFADEPGLSSG